MEENLKNEIENELKKAENLDSLSAVLKKYSLRFSETLKSLKRLPEEQRKAKGKEANELKSFLNDLFALRKSELEKGEKKDYLDITVPGKKLKLGHLHPVTKVIKRLSDIFEKMGFSVVDGPLIESEFYNFDALNIPKDHPARDMWDTFWLKDKKLLLRTHTSPVQVRFMENHKPPFRIIVPGKAFRHEATDASHEFDFNQVEGLMVDKNISAANFKALIEEFFKRFFEKDLEVRLRPSYFPFTEPSFEIDLLCLNCVGKGCSVCKKTGYLEMMGAGMVHPNVFKAAKVKGKWQGFAFGMGIERLTMLRYKINDIRLFNSGDLRFLEQF